MKHWTNAEIVVGDEVSYRSVSLWERRGIVVDLTPVWATVEWTIFGVKQTSKEWIKNLQAWRETS